MLSFEQVKLLCDTFEKKHIRARTVSLQTLSTAALAENAENTDHRFEKTLSSIKSKITQRAQYIYMDELSICHRIIPLDDSSELLIIGPYLPSALTDGDIFEIAERNGLTPKSKKHLTDFFNSLTVLDDSSALMALLNSFCEHLWQRPNFQIIEIGKDGAKDLSPLTDGQDREDEDILLTMEAMERRYSFENDMIRAVTLGQTHKEESLFSLFSEPSFEMRSTDRLRNAKNYCIIMNTLLRKAAESGGVHPLYIDRMSGDFALRIERLISFTDTEKLMREMFRSYCRLVRKHAMRGYSMVVRKAILLIDSDLSADLSLSAVAQKLSVSAGYLSAVFKKETNSTLTSYVKNKRMDLAMHLLDTTVLQIQSISQHCGILDIQYFSKQFKAHTGKTPMEYRERDKS